MENPAKKRSVNTDSLLKNLPAADIQLGGTVHKRNTKTGLTGFSIKALSEITPVSSFRTFIAFDTETTGLSVKDDVIEIAAIRFVDFVPQMQFSTLIRPKVPISPQASAVNHITDDMVKDAPYFHELLPSMDAFFGDTPLVAHNAMFDVRMMYVNGMDSMRSKTVYDTCEISNHFDIALMNHKLNTACKAHQIVIGNAHRAASDAMACGLLFVQYLLKQYGCGSVEELQNKMAGEDVLC